MDAVMKPSGARSQGHGYLHPDLGGSQCPFCSALSLPGPAILHPERAQAGERPPLLPALQRQPALRDREAIVFGARTPAPVSRHRERTCPFCVAAASAPRGCQSPQGSGISRAGRTLELHTVHTTPPLPCPPHASFSVLTTAQSAAPFSCRGGVLRPTAGQAVPPAGRSRLNPPPSVRSHIGLASIMRQKGQRLLRMFPPSCHSTCLPSPPPWPLGEGLPPPPSSLGWFLNCLEASLLSVGGG